MSARRDATARRRRNRAHGAIMRRRLRDMRHAAMAGQPGCSEPGGLFERSRRGLAAARARAAAQACTHCGRTGVPMVAWHEGGMVCAPDVTGCWCPGC